MKRVFQSLILIPFLLIACQPPQAVNTSTPTPNPTLTPLFPTKTATPTFQENTKHIELPEWVNNPENNILLLRYNESGSPYSKFMLFNFVTNENVLIDLNLPYYEYYWEDKNIIVFLHDGVCDVTPKYVTEFDITKGVLHTYKIENYLKPVKNCTYNYIYDNTARINKDKPESVVEVLDSVTGDYVPLTSNNDGLSDISFKVSPDGTYIFILQYKGIYEFSELWRPINGSVLSIFNIESRSLIMKLDEEQEISSDILFIDDNNLVFTRDRTTPCLIMISSLTKKCMHTIPEKLNSATVVLGEPLLDSHKINFLYFSGERGGVCFYDIYDGKINCPTQNFQELDEQIILIYDLSPDEKQLLFLYSYKGCPAPYCDYSGEISLAIIDINSNYLYQLPKSTSFRWDSVWRP